MRVCVRPRLPPSVPLYVRVFFVLRTTSSRVTLFVEAYLRVSFGSLRCVRACARVFVSLLVVVRSLADPFPSLSPTFYGYYRV